MIERELLERPILTPNQLRINQEEQSDRPNSQDEDTHNNTPSAARSYEAEGKSEYLHKMQEWMQLGSERPRIPSLKTNSQKNLEEKSKEVNDIPRLIHTNNITETNNLVHAGARLAVELMELTIPQNSHSERKPNQPPWKRCLENS